MGDSFVHVCELCGGDYDVRYSRAKEMKRFCSRGCEEEERTQTVTAWPASTQTATGSVGQTLVDYFSHATLQTLEAQLQMQALQNGQRTYYTSQFWPANHFVTPGGSNGSGS